MLGETVAALRVANNWSLQELAARVNQAGAQNVRYQHIQQLESKPDTSPRYLVELARAFGKTVEELRQWDEGMPPYGPHDTQRKPLFIREPEAPVFSRRPSLDEQEEAMMENFRACTPEVQNALRLVIAASADRSGKRARS